MNSAVWKLSLPAGILMLAGCSLTQDFATSGQQANARWNEMRSQLKCRIAEDCFDRGQLDDALKHVQEAVTLAPESPKPYVLLTRVLLERGEMAAADQALSHVSGLGNASPETDYLRGVVAQRYGRWDEALDHYRSASEREPRNADYVAATAEALVALDRVADALALVQDRWTDLEHSATLKALAGEIYLMLGRYEEASRAYRQAARIVPNDRMVKYQLGTCLTLAGNFLEGKEVLLDATKDDEKVPALVRSSLVRCHLELGEYAPAKALLREAVAEKPGSARDWALLAEASLGTSDLITARQAATKAAQCDPGNPDYAMVLAYVCLSQKDNESAQSSLRPILVDNPENPIALYLMGRSYEQSGDARAAIACYDRAVLANPDHPWARQRLNRLRQPGGNEG